MYCFLQTTIEISHQVLSYLEKDNQEDETLFKFRAITGHQGPLENDDPN